LRFLPGEGLSSVLYGERPARADIENLLLYNIDSSGGRFAAAASVHFEQAPPLAGWPFTYAYRVARPEAAFVCYAPTRVVATIGPAAIVDGPPERLLESVCLAVKSADAVRVSAPAGAPLALRLRVALPRRPRSGIGGLVKGVFDGVVAGMAVDAGSSDVSIERLAARCLRPAEEVAGLLRAGAAPLGSARLLMERGPTSVHWYPPDDQLVAGSLSLEPAPAPRLTVEGDLIEVAPSSS
jgi:hypothetical protein